MERKNITWHGYVITCAILLCGLTSRATVSNESRTPTECQCAHALRHAGAELSYLAQQLSRVDAHPDGKKQRRLLKWTANTLQMTLAITNMLRTTAQSEEKPTPEAGMPSLPQHRFVWPTYCENCRPPDEDEQENTILLEILSKLDTCCANLETALERQSTIAL